MNDKKKIIEEIFDKSLYHWDGYSIMSTEFIDHVGKVLDKYSIKKKRKED